VSMNERARTFRGFKAKVQQGDDPCRSDATECDTTKPRSLNWSAF
jgi:hypothetical protein